jgi:hypothetical protein
MNVLQSQRLGPFGSDVELGFINVQPDTFAIWPSVQTQQVSYATDSTTKVQAPPTRLNADFCQHRIRISPEQVTLHAKPINLVRRHCQWICVIHNVFFIEALSDLALHTVHQQDDSQLRPGEGQTVASDIQPIRVGFTPRTPGSVREQSFGPQRTGFRPPPNQRL